MIVSVGDGLDAAIAERSVIVVEGVLAVADWAGVVAGASAQLLPKFSSQILPDKPAITVS